MSMQIVCPSCQTTYHVPADQDGKKVRCKKCQTIFVAGLTAPKAVEPPAEEPAPRRQPAGEPADSETSKRRPRAKAEEPAEDEAIERRDRSHPRSAAAAPRRRDRFGEEDDEPRRRKPKAAGRGLSPLALTLIIGGVVGCLVIIGGSVFFLAWWVGRDTSDAKVGEPHIVNPRPFAVQVGGGAPDGGDEPPVAAHEDKEKPDPTFKEGPPPEGPPKTLQFVAPPPAEVVAAQPTGPATVQLQAAVVQRVKGATVFLRVTMGDGSMASGSGFFAGQPNVILTNAHVVGMLQPGTRPPKKIEVIQDSGTDKQRKFPGQLLGFDRTADLAVLRVQADETPPPLDVKSARNLIETQKVWIVGFPLGEQLGREITVSDSSVSSFRKDDNGVLNRVQVNGGMNPGNSGGPVVDSFGNVVGVAVSGYMGTQINFAVPGDYVRTILDGRISGYHLGQPFLKDGVTRLPVRLELIDPLGHIKKPALEVWTGDPSPASRAPSATKPTVQPGDTPHQRFDLQRRGNGAHGEVTLEPLEPGKAYLIQPTWVNAAGQTVWATAHVCALPPPVDLRPALLMVKHETGDRLLHLNQWTDEKISDLQRGEQHLIRNAEAELTETTQAIDDQTEQATVRLRYKNYNADLKYNNQSPPPEKSPQRLRKPMVGVTATFQLDKQGNPVPGGQQVDTQHVPAGLQVEVGAAHNGFQQVLDALAVPLPNKQVTPGETWKGERLLPHPPTLSMPGMVSGKLELTYTYVGARKRDGREEGVITFTGQVPNGNRSPGHRLLGKAEGTVVVELATGQVSQAEGRFTFDEEAVQIPLPYPLKSLGTMNVRLKRTPPTTSGK